MKWDANLYENKHDFVAEYGKGLLEFIPEKENLLILDIGCGTGTLTSKLTCNHAIVKGIDGSVDMIALAQKEHPEIEFTVQDALALDDKNQWDVIFSNAVFHWITNQDLLLHNIYQALKVNGLLICEFGAINNVHHIEDAIHHELNHMGFESYQGFFLPGVEEYRTYLLRHNFVIDNIYDYDRPTPLKDGRFGLRNWIKQFHASVVAMIPDNQREAFFTSIETKLEDELWDGKQWVADYRRLRVIAHKEA